MTFNKINEQKKKGKTGRIELTNQEIKSTLVGKNG